MLAGPNARREQKLPSKRCPAVLAYRTVGPSSSLLRSSNFRAAAGIEPVGMMTATPRDTYKKTLNKSLSISTIDFQGISPEPLAESIRTTCSPSSKRATSPERLMIRRRCCANPVSEPSVLRIPSERKITVVSTGPLKTSEAAPTASDNIVRQVAIQGNKGCQRCKNSVLAAAASERSSYFTINFIGKRPILRLTHEPGNPLAWLLALPCQWPSRK